MKNIYINLNGIKRVSTTFLSFLILFLFILPAVGLIAQEEQASEDKPVRNSFTSTWLIDNQSSVVPIKGTFQFDILHRFGHTGNGYGDFFGFYASANMKLGFSYTPIENLSVGFGLTKRKHLLDFNWKYSLLRQLRSDRIPVSVTYFGNVAVDTREELVREILYNWSDRYSFFHQIIVARKFTPWLSLQVAGSVSHFNIVPEGIKHDHYAIAGGAKIRISDTFAGLINVDQPITKHKVDNPNPNLSFGVEVSTSSHAFQVFAGNYSAIVPQENNLFNNNGLNPGGDETLFDNFLVGFNITRLWNW
jgi:hypothetical protein